MERAETLGIKKFIKWVGKRGKITDTSRDGVGYDFKVKWHKMRLIETYEVKGSSKTHKIPDMSIREFNNKGILKADWLFVVGNVNKKGKEVIYKIPRKAIKKDNLKLKQAYHIAKFQNKKTMSHYELI